MYALAAQLSTAECRARGPTDNHGLHRVHTLQADHCYLFSFGVSPSQFRRCARETGRNTRRRWSGREPFTDGATIATIAASPVRSPARPPCFLPLLSSHELAMRKVTREPATAPQPSKRTGPRAPRLSAGRLLHSVPNLGQSRPERQREGKHNTRAAHTQTRTHTDSKIHTNAHTQHHIFVVCTTLEIHQTSGESITTTQTGSSNPISLVCHSVSAPSSLASRPPGDDLALLSNT